ncbi:MAG: hypothetical protein GY862_37930 [Gammaproteobacteria bacterium]|nr:hypothetical protein [Gammaproteobacteria bacterium]
MTNDKGQMTKIYLDLPAELRRVLDSLTVEDVLRREEVDIALEIREEELPAAHQDERERDIGLALMGTAALTLSIGAAAAMVILALSRFLKDREHAPQVVEVYVEKETTGPDGKLRRQLVLEKRFIQPHTAKSSAELAAKLGLREGVVVKFRTETDSGAG